MANNAETSSVRATLLLTRPAASAARFAAELDPAVTRQVRLLISPLQEIVSVDARYDLCEYAAVIFSSANGVLHAPDGAGMTAYCVGQRTAEAAEIRGWRVVKVAQDADGLVAAMQGVVDAGPVLHLSGTHQRGDIAKRLTESGIRTDRSVIYDQRALPLSDDAQKALNGEGAVVLPLFSPRTAAQFVQAASSMDHVYAIAMSAAVAAEISGQGVKELQILKAPTGQEMLRTVELLFSGDRLP